MPINYTLDQLIKDCLIAIYSVIILVKENHNLQAINKHIRKKRNKKLKVLYNKDILTVSKG